MIYVVMGVSGSGKTTIGKLLAKRLHLPFYDADDFHTTGNITKMFDGIPLKDEDRHQWLNILSQKIKDWEQEGGAVLACSALKENYRNILSSIPAQHMHWIFLKGSPELIKTRIIQRKEHFMSPALLKTQFEALEEPHYGIFISVDDTPENIVDKILKQLT